MSNEEYKNKVSFGCFGVSTVDNFDVDFMLDALAHVTFKKQRK